MTLYRTVEPAVEPVTLVEAKAQLRIAHDSEDALLEGLIRAARSEVEAQAGIALTEQSWRLALDEWPPSGIVRLRRHPVREVLSVTVYGREGEAAIVNPGDYEIDMASRPARLRLLRRVDPGKCMNGIEIDFAAGFGEAGADVPDLLKRAIMILVAHWYEFRGSFRAKDQPVSFPAGFDRMLAGYRAGRL